MKITTWTTFPKLKVPAQSMKEIGVLIKNLIREDNLNGLWQDDTGPSRYRSAQYMRYKNNWMRRFTRGTAKGYTTRLNKKGELVSQELYFQNPKSKYSAKRQGTSGTHLKAVEGQSVVDNTTSWVTMTLTGQMIKGLQGRFAKPNEIFMAYLPKDAGKIIGNRALGREVVGLNSKNQDLVKEEIVKYLNTIIEGWAKEDIIIQIG